MSGREWFVDAGYWIAWANSRDIRHARARALASGLRRPLVTTEAVLLEVGNTFARPPWRSVACSLLSRVRANPNITIVAVDADLSARALALYVARPDKEWGLTDCVSFVVMQDRGITEALAADRHFVQAGFRALLRES
ncbi:MAG: type II toxin-antitoxin system VapC family toxin [Dehalococcoidia bacterium]